MDKVKIQKTFYKIFSLMLATGLWFFVSSQGDSTIKKTISNVTVTISGETDLTENGFAVVDKNLKANVTVSGNRASLRRLNNKTLSASINVSSLKEAGTHMVPATVSSVVNTTATFNAKRDVKIEIEPIVTKKFEVLKENIKSPQDTSLYLVESTFNKNTVTVSAGESVMKKIDSIKTEPIDTKKNEKEFTAKLIAYGKNNEEIHNGVTINPKEISVNCTLFPVRTVPIVLVTTEGNEIELPKANTIRISGNDSLFEETENIKTDAINLALFKPGDTTTLNLIIPEGIILPDKASETTVEIKEEFYK